jgi:hypothetical protein
VQRLDLTMETVDHEVERALLGKVLAHEIMGGFASAT